MLLLPPLLAHPRAEAPCEATPGSALPFHGGVERLGLDLGGLVAMGRLGCQIVRAGKGRAVMLLECSLAPKTLHNYFSSPQAPLI